MINLDEVNIEQLSSDPIQRPTFKNGGFLHAVAQVFAWLTFDTTLTPPHPGCSVALHHLDHPDYHYLLYDYYQQHVIDCQFSTIQSLLAATVSSILKTHHIAILSPVLSSLLSWGVALPPSGGVHSTDLPKATFAMTTLYKPIIGLGGGIHHIFDVKSENFDIRHIFDVKSENFDVKSSKNTYYKD